MAKRNKNGENNSKVQETKEVKKRGPAAKPVYPGVGETRNGIVYPFSETPPDFDFNKYKGLKTKDFETTAAYLEYRADALEFKAAKLRNDAEMERKFGNKADRSKAKRIKKYLSKIDELKAQLEEQGIDVNELIGADE